VFCSNILHQIDKKDKRKIELVRSGGDDIIYLLLSAFATDVLFVHHYVKATCFTLGIFNKRRYLFYRLLINSYKRKNQNIKI
jgi:hypothetical protein